MSTIDFVIPTMNISPVRISTMVTTAHVGTLIRLEELFEHIQVIPYWLLTDGVLKMEFQGKAKGISWKDIMQRPDKEKAKTFFFNQATIVIRMEVAPCNWKEINIKLFRNGGVQMTGVRSEEMSWNAIRWLVNYIQTTIQSPIFVKPAEPTSPNPDPANEDTEEGTEEDADNADEEAVVEVPAVLEAAIVNIHKMQIQLVNTDFSIGAKIRRENLYKILSEDYHLTVSYEPSIYQGVKTKYFYNHQRPNNAMPGLCPCDKLCKGTGDGSRLGFCKKITISPFQTGQVIITGARTMHQIEEAYEFMKSVFHKHAANVLRKNYICPTTETQEQDKPKKVGWIHHPSPRNIHRIPTERLIDAPIA
jgi:hypothetical protein